MVLPELSLANGRRKQEWEQSSSERVYYKGKHLIDGNKLREDMVNRVAALVRPYHPCFSCPTHANGLVAVNIHQVDHEGKLLDEVQSIDRVPDNHSGCD